MYLDYFQFKEAPFSIAPDPRFLYMSTRHQEGLAHLFYGINKGGGFVALTGEVGTGKTTLCRCLLEQMPEDVDIAFILNPKLNALELLANICDELDITYPQHNQSLKMYTDSLNTYLLDSHACGRRTVLMIDEAQNLSLEVLEQIRLLTNLETSTTKLLQIVLVGQPELQQLLQSKELRQLNQRITARYHLESLSFAGTRAYIAHRLSISGGRTNIFTKSAIRRIYKLSSGIPRLINLLCDRSLLGAYATEQLKVTPQIVAKAGKEVLPPVTRERRLNRLALLALMLITTVSAATYYIQRLSLPSTALLKHSQIANPGAEKLNPVPKTPNLPNITTAQNESHFKFSEFIYNPELNIDNALSNLLETWNPAKPSGQALNCEVLQKMGYQCLFDQDSWMNMLQLNRPAILEFTLPDQDKRYALLVGTHQGNPILRLNNNETFELEEVLDYWQGYFLLLWQPPDLQAPIINAHQKSTDVLWLRKQLDLLDNKTNEVKQPLFFDYVLEQRVKTFQKQHNLTADGVAGPRTIIQLQNILDAKSAPGLQITE